MRENVRVAIFEIERFPPRRRSASCLATRLHTAVPGGDHFPKGMALLMQTKNSIEARWTKRLATQFCPVSSYFLNNYHRLKPNPAARALNSTEAMVIIHLVDHKWDDRAPFPTVRTLATRMSLSVRGVRNALQTLESNGYVRREASATGGPNRYHLQGLFEALERLMATDVAAQEVAVAQTTEAA